MVRMTIQHGPDQAGSRLRGLRTQSGVDKTERKRPPALLCRALIAGIAQAMEGSDIAAGINVPPALLQMNSASGAIQIPADAGFVELHIEGVDHQETSGKRPPYP
jgi:hypothetical protein